MSGVTWVYIMLGIYVVYAFWEGMKGFFAEKTTAGYAIGGRSVPFIAFLMAATAASFSGWTFIGHPGLIWRDGSGLRLRVVLRADNPHQRHLLRQAPVAARQALRVHHARRHVRLLFQQRALALPGGHCGPAVFPVLLGGADDGLGGAVSMGRRRSPSFMAPGSWPSSSGSTSARAA